jgi:hypothetical protein
LSAFCWHVFIANFKLQIEINLVAGDSFASRRFKPAFLTSVCHCLLASSAELLTYVYTACKQGTDRRLVEAHCFGTYWSGEKSGFGESFHLAWRGAEGYHCTPCYCAAALHAPLRAVNLFSPNLNQRKAQTT